MDYHPRGSLHKYIHESKLTLSPAQFAKIIEGLLNGMHRLHCENIVHRDFKTSNILLDSNMNPVICDFGSSKKLMKTQIMDSTEVGTLAYAAPEAMTIDDDYDKKIDIYSFGVVLWEIVHYKIPFAEIPVNQFHDRVYHEGYRPKITMGLPIIRQTIEQCWHQNPRERKTFVEIHFDLEDLFKNPE